MNSRKASVRLLPLLLVLALTLATDLVLRDFWFCGLATPDPPLLFILWLAMVSRRRSTHFALLLVSLLRSLFGLDSFLESWLPLAVSTELIHFLAKGFYLVPLTRRLLAILLANGTAIFLAQLATGEIQTGWALTSAHAGLLGCLLALALIPILDSLEHFLLPRGIRS